MSIVTLFEYPRKLIVAMPLINIIGNIKSGKYADSVDRLRDMYHCKLDTLFNVQKRHIPVFTIAGNFNFQSERLELVSYSRYLFFEVKYLRPDKMRDVRLLLERNPYIFSIFKNALGLGICFIVKVDVGKGYHDCIYKKAYRYFEKNLGIDRIQKDGLELTHACMMSYDPRATINPACIPFPYYGTPKF